MIGRSRLAGRARRPPGGVDHRREVRGGRVAVGIGDPLGGGHQRAEGGVAVAVERLGDDHPGPGGDPDGGAAGGPADHRADGVRAVAVVVVGRRPPVREVAPGHDLPGQVGVIGVHAGVDRADRDAAAVQPVVAPHRRRADGRQAPVAPAEAPRRRARGRPPAGPRTRTGRSCSIRATAGSRASRRISAGVARRASAFMSHSRRAGRAQARQERPAALRPGRAPQRADQVGGPSGVVRGAHLGAEGHEDGQRPVRPREPGGQRRRERAPSPGPFGEAVGAPAPAATPPGAATAAGGDGGEADERARPVTSVDPLGESIGGADRGVRGLHRPQQALTAPASGR